MREQRQLMFGNIYFRYIEMNYPAKILFQSFVKPFYKENAGTFVFIFILKLLCPYVFQKMLH